MIRWNKINENKMKMMAHLLLFFIFVSCNINKVPTTENTQNVSIADPSMVGKAYVYRDNPIALSNNYNLSPFINIRSFVDFTNPVDVMNNPIATQLEDDCYAAPSVQKSGCVKVLGSEKVNQPVLQSNQGTWVFAPGTSEFYQVQAMFQAKQSINRFFEVLLLAHSQVENPLLQLQAVSFPPYLYSQETYWFNFANTNLLDISSDQLTIYATCSEQRNAYYMPALNRICLGTDDTNPLFLMVQDPTMLYHELGHVFVKIMSNVRNNPSSTPYTTGLESVFYNEAKSINEGIADYFSYAINARPHVFEWGAGVVSKQSRPLHEDDPIHAVGISSAVDERLSYPHYVHYDPNFPEDTVEDVHYAGQIFSHFFVRVTEMLKEPNQCNVAGMSHQNASNIILSMIAHSLAELGDLTASKSQPLSGLNHNGGYHNLNVSNAFDWAMYVNPPTFKKFMQVFSKNINQYVFNGNFCDLSSFVDLKFAYEQLVDSYGLLLFENYNDNFHREDLAIAQSPALSEPTPIDSMTRLKTVMVSKENIKIASDVDPTKFTASIDDRKAKIKNDLANLLYRGQVVTATANVSSPDFNNANAKISPGEIVAILINLFNASNSDIGGVRILATDWDHMKITNQTTGVTKPCIFENWPLLSEGGIESENDNVEGNCNYISRDAKQFKIESNNLYPKDTLHPVCLVEYTAENETKWVSQNEYRSNPNMLLEDQKCLGSGSPDFNPNECLVRFMKGMQQAFMSKISAQKTYAETLKGNSAEAPKLEISSALFLEVNKWIPPGTTFNCRLRVQFSNCSDCFVDPNSPGAVKDEFRDYHYNGPEPFKLLNFRFTVID